MGLNWYTSTGQDLFMFEWATATLCSRVSRLQAKSAVRVTLLTQSDINKTMYLHLTSLPCGEATSMDNRFLQPFRAAGNEWSNQAPEWLQA